MDKETKEKLDKLNVAIQKHKALAAWGNVESKERLKVLRANKRELLKDINNKITKSS
jgi:hypothetical protein